MFRNIKQFTHNLSNSIRFPSIYHHPPDSLRVCSVYYQSFGALLYREAKALKEVGMTVDIICYANSREARNLTFYDGINIYPIQSRQSRETSVLLYFLHLTRFFLKSFAFLSYSGIRKRYAVIHITTPPDFLVFAAIIPKLFGTKIIMDIHDIGPEFYMRSLDASERHVLVRLIRFIEKLSTRFSDHVIAVTDLWRDKLVARSISSAKCTTLINVPDHGLFQILPQDKGKVSNSFDLYYHGSVEEIFGVDTLIKAMPAIIKHIPDVKLHIYGKGRLLSHCKEVVNDFHIHEFVVFHNPVPFYKLPPILAQADIGIVPTKGSIFSDEILAMKSLEYISLGIPIVISKTKGHSYYYDSSMVKFFKPNDEDDLSNAVIELYHNRSEREKLVTNSRDFIERYGWKRTKKIYLQIVDNLIS